MTQWWLSRTGQPRSRRCRSSSSLRLSPEGKPGAGAVRHERVSQLPDADSARLHPIGDDRLCRVPREVRRPRVPFYKQLMWEQHHYRFGLAGEGQADTVAEWLDRARGVVLDLGCGLNPIHVRNLASHCLYLIAADLEPGMVVRSGAPPRPKNVSFLVADAFALPLAPSSLDCVVAFGLLAYIHEPARLFGELRRVLKAGGVAMLTNAASRPRNPITAAASQLGMDLIAEQEGHCPAASGNVKRRYMLTFQAPSVQQVHDRLPGPPSAHRP